MPRKMDEVIIETPKVGINIKALAIVIFYLIVGTFFAITWKVNVERDIKDRPTMEIVRELMKQELKPIAEDVDGIDKKLDALLLKK